MSPLPGIIPGNLGFIPGFLGMVLGFLGSILGFPRMVLGFLGFMYPLPGIIPGNPGFILGFLGMVLGFLGSILSFPRMVPGFLGMVLGFLGSILGFPRMVPGFLGFIFPGPRTVLRRGGTQTGRRQPWPGGLAARPGRQGHFGGQLHRRLPLQTTRSNNGSGPLVDFPWACDSRFGGVKKVMLSFSSLDWATCPKTS